MKKNNAKKEDKSNLFVLITMILVVIFLLFLPSIYNFVEKSKLPKVESNENSLEKEKKEVEEEVLESIHYPIMRTDIYSTYTYYSLDKFKISDMSNNDILVNAFLDVYEGNMTPYYGYTACSTNSKQFNKDYLTLRIKNILGKNIKYNLENFNVPVGMETNYVGEWKYDSNNSIFIYNGLCNSNTKTTRYYDIKQFIKARYLDDDIIVYYYVGFAKVDNNNYVLYSDSELKNEISSGSINDIKELDSIFEKVDNKNKKIYKFTFKNNLCSYDEYCLYEGEWTNEI